MKIQGGKARIGGALALLLPLVPAPAEAQSSPIFTLPAARPSSNPRAQGPVDEENPIVHAPPARPTPTPTFAPAPVATESVPPPAGPTARPDTRPAQSAAQPARATTAVSGSQATPAPITNSQVPAAQPPAPVAEGSPLIQPAATTTDSFELPAATGRAAAASPGGYWLWFAGGSGLLAALLALLWWRRRPKTLRLEFEAPMVAAHEPELQPVSVPELEPAQVSKPAPQPEVAPAKAGLAIALEARRMNASLMATTLSYSLRLTNNSAEPLSGLAVEGDMVSAHASLPTERQIAGSSQRLEHRHALVTLEPGESAEFSGDFRLPLTAITPIRAGEAAYFVPLARLRVEARQSSGAQLVEVQTFVVGELAEQPGAALRPFRLDLGPRTYSRLGQRAVS